MEFNNVYPYHTYIKKKHLLTCSSFHVAPPTFSGPNPIRTVHKINKCIKSSIRLLVPHHTIYFAKHHICKQKSDKMLLDAVISGVPSKSATLWP